MAEHKKQKPQAPPRSKVIQLLEEIERVVGNQECIFRGEPKKFKKVTSRLYRKLGEQDVVPTEQFSEELEKLLTKHAEGHSKVPLTNDGLLADSKEASFNLGINSLVDEKLRKTILHVLQKNDADKAKEWAGSTKSNVEISAELQHHGGDTNLIDFSESFLVALFFACSNKDHIDENGYLIILPKNNLEKIPNDGDGQIVQDIPFIIRPLPDNRRALIQRSVMLHEPRGFLGYDDKRIEVRKIPATLKLEILDYLNKFCDISDRTLFPDIQGYIESQKFVWRPMNNLEKAYARLEEEEYDDVLKVATAAIKSGDEDVTLYRVRARANSMLGRSEEALSDYSAAIKLDEKNPELYLIRARTQWSLDCYEEALSDINRALELDDKNPEMYDFRAWIHDDMHHPEEALSDINRAIELDDKNAGRYSHRAWIYHFMGRYEEALSDINRALELDDREYGLYEHRTLIYGHLERHEEALSDSNRVLELNDKDPGAYGLRAEVYQNMHRYEEALSDYSRAIELDDKNATLYRLRANSFRHLKRYEEALEDVNYGLNLDDEDARLYVLRAGICHDMHRYEEALFDYNRAIELDDENVALYHRRVGIYRHLKRYEEALEDNNHILELDNNSADRYFSRAETYRRLNRYDEALLDINRAIELDNNDALFYGTRAQIYKGLGKQEKAQFELAIALDLAEKQDNAELVEMIQQDWDEQESPDQT